MVLFFFFHVFFVFGCLGGNEGQTGTLASQRVSYCRDLKAETSSVKSKKPCYLAERSDSEQRQSSHGSVVRRERRAR